MSLRERRTTAITSYLWMYLDVIKRFGEIGTLELWRDREGTGTYLSLM
ncbi:unnamed protein product [Acidithrix sp. C25]|nr:unnamed protein product [Acidithrix sp. C25]